MEPFHFHNGSFSSMGFSVDTVVKNLSANAGNVGSTPGSGRFPGEENGKPLQYCCLENLMDREGWQATVQEVAESVTTQHSRANTPSSLVIWYQAPEHSFMDEMCV